MKILWRKEHFEWILYILNFGFLLLDICGFLGNIGDSQKELLSISSKNMEETSTDEQRSYTLPDTRRYFTSCRSCVVPNSKQVIRNEDVCRERSPDGIFLIISAPGNFKERRTIRETWANRTVVGELNLRYIFTIGNNRNVTENDALLREQREFGDIVQFHFPDSYGTLAMKRIFGIRWILANCRQAKYVIYTDDDVFFNVFTLRRLLGNGVFSAENTVYGKCFGSGIPHRDALSKWYAPYRVYPYTNYGPFCLGMVRVLSRRTNDRIARGSQSVRYFHLEDVFTTSLVTRAVSTRNIDGISIYQQRVIGCMANSSAVAVLTSTTEHMHSLWKQITIDNCI